MASNPIWRVRSTGVVSSGEIGQLEFNDIAHAKRTTPVGAEWTILGPGGSALALPGQGFTTVMLANTTAQWRYVKFGTTAAVTAPTGLTDGYPIPPNSIMYYAAGLDTSGNLQRYVICDSASVGVYAMIEFTGVINVNKNQQ